MSGLTVLVDSCVLHPAPLRDLVMHLALLDVLRAKWTEYIHEKWIRSVLASRSDLARDRLERTRTLMNSHVCDALVMGYEPLIEGLSLPDPDDRHILAAAIRCNADLILTFNLKDFPEESLRPFGIEAQHPDPFLVDQLGLDQATLLKAIKRQREGLKNPPKLPLEFLDTLEQQQLPLFVAELRRFADII